MGVRYKAYTIIGQRIEIDQLMEEKKIEINIHKDCGEQKGNFCSNCGQPTGFKIETKKVLKEGVQQKYEGEWDDATIGGLELLAVYWGDYRTYYFIVNKIVGSADDFNDGIQYTAPHLDLNKHKEYVEKVLSPLGLWIPENFGIWTVLQYL